jgi:hypothetical protein
MLFCNEYTPGEVIVAQDVIFVSASAFFLITKPKKTKESTNISATVEKNLLLLLQNKAIHHYYSKLYFI